MVSTICRGLGAESRRRTYPRSSALHPQQPDSLLPSHPLEPELPFQAQVLFQDAHLVVADKPHFMPVTPAGRYVRKQFAGAVEGATRH
jgi:23S rRNA-/tRNA-specific pseudouridylate synthase